MIRIAYVPGACDVLHVSEHLQGCVQAWGFHGGRPTARRFAIKAISMSAVWLDAQLHCCSHTASLKSLVPNSWTAKSVRPSVGIFLAIVAAFVGWFYSPTAAVLIFRFALGYDTWTSRGLHGGHAASWIDRT